MLITAFFIELFFRRRFEIPAFTIAQYPLVLAFRVGFAVTANAFARMLHDRVGRHFV
jgi:hypothetical protein